MTRVLTAAVLLILLAACQAQRGDSAQQAQGVTVASPQTSAGDVTNLVPGGAGGGLPPVAPAPTAPPNTTQQQSGAGNVAAELDTTVTGIAYTSALPLGVLILCVCVVTAMAVGMVLSHRREAARLRQRAAALDGLLARGTLSVSYERR